MGVSCLMSCLDILLRYAFKYYSVEFDFFEVFSVTTRYPCAFIWLAFLFICLIHLVLMYKSTFYINLVNNNVNADILRYCGIKNLTQTR